MSITPSVQPPSEVALLINPVAGRGRGAVAAATAAARLRADGVGVRELVGAGGEQVGELARRAVASGVDALVAVGGDGMVHLCLPAIVGTSTPLGVIPAGTGNDYAHALRLPDDPFVAAGVILAGHRRRVDAVRTAAGWWAGVLGAGFDSAVNERANRMRWPRGPRRYDVAMLAELGVFRPIPFTLVLDGQRWETEAMLVAVGNGISYGAGMRICPAAELDDGLLDVTVIGPIGKPTLLRLFPTVYRGAHVDHPAVTVRRAATVSLDAPGVTAYADGERLAPLPVTNECVPGAVEVFAPPVADLRNA